MTMGIFPDRKRKGMKHSSLNNDFKAESGNGRRAFEVQTIYLRHYGYCPRYSNALGTGGFVSIHFPQRLGIKFRIRKPWLES